MTKIESVRLLVKKAIRDALDNGQSSVDIYAKEIHTALGFDNRYPIVCDGMQDVMVGPDVIIEKKNAKPNERGYYNTSSLAIRYYTLMHADKEK